MTAQVLFLDAFFFEKDPHINAVEIVNVPAPVDLVITQADDQVKIRLFRN